jgi:hypothetical protein
MMLTYLKIISSVMQLALFTPGACIWPVHRNFEAFIAELGADACDAIDVLDSSTYPVRSKSESGVSRLSERMDHRLFALHQDLYRSLLKPTEFFHGERRSMAELFWPDLLGGSAAELLSALTFHFIQRPAEDASVIAGLRVLRTVFFQHEMTDPGLWIHSARENLAAHASNWSSLELQLMAPAATRLHDLAFTVHGRRDRPAESSGWFSGRIRRNNSGECRIQLRCGADRGMLEHNPDLLQQRCSAETARYLCSIFGWQEAAA